jgi:hypothetical protein
MWRTILNGEPIDGSYEYLVEVIRNSGLIGGKIERI